MKDIHVETGKEYTLRVQKHKLEEDRKEAIEFAGSPRGVYIISQALSVAIETMMKTEKPYQETSNIADMQFLRDYLFDTFPSF